MRKICYVCDRCGAEIDGNAAIIRVKEQDSQGYEEDADLLEVSNLFSDTGEKNLVENAISPGWDLCCDCLVTVLRTLIKADKPRVKCNLPDYQIAPKKKGRPRKTVERKLDQMEAEREKRENGGIPEE